MSQAKKPCLSVEDKFSGWKRDIPWIETRNTISLWDYRCVCCAKNPNGGVWKEWRALDAKTQKSLFAIHNSYKVHSESVKLAADVEKNNTFWKTHHSAASEQKEKEHNEFLKKKRDQVRSVLFLAKEEIPLAKYRSLLKYASGLDGSKVTVDHHSSTCAGWEFLESCDNVIQKRDAQIIREAKFHSLIIDSTNDLNDWVVILARCITPDRKTEIVLWDLICMQNAKAVSFVDAVWGLYQRDGVNVQHLVGWATDGCPTMKKAVRDFEVKAGIKLIWCHCLAHRIDLALSADLWESSALCKDVENAMRGAYFMFNRSTQRRKELQALVVEFGKVKIPASLIGIRWLSKLKCLEIFASPGTSNALKHLINCKSPDNINPIEASIFLCWRIAVKNCKTCSRFCVPWGT